MDYFALLNLKKEPFSNSPDPDFFFRSRQHLACLQGLEIALRLRRGLNVVIGEIGTGKTTLCRQLIRRFADDPDVSTHLILDPAYPTPFSFLKALGDALGISPPPAAEGEAAVLALKESIRNHLFREGAEMEKTVILIIDEGQKLPPLCAEVLRELLNYETNEHKLLQIVIFAQPEFEAAMNPYPNFTDRINLLYRMGSLDFGDMRQMIRYRLENARDRDRDRDRDHPLPRFTFPALWALYRITRGYPRKVIRLCHHCLLTMIVQNRSRVTRSVVLSCGRRSGLVSARPKRLLGITAAALCLIGIFGGLLLGRDRLPAKPQPAPIPAAPLPPKEPRTRQPLLPEVSPGPFREVRVRAGETLGELIRSIYGTVTPEVLEAVCRENPQIKSPHRLSIGDRVRLPATLTAADGTMLQARIPEDRGEAGERR